MDCALAQLLQPGLTSFVDLEDSLATLTPPMKGSSTVRIDPQLLYARLPITTVSAYLEATIVNLAEYSGMNNRIQAALDIGATNLVIVGDLRLAIQQPLGVIACKKEPRMTQLNRHRELVARLKSVKYLHAVREYNTSADSLATEASENKASSVIPTGPRLAELRSLNRIQEIIYASITESSVDKPSISITQSQVQTRHLRHTKPSQRSGTVPEIFGFVREDQREKGNLTVTTRLQAKSKPKRVRFADKTSVADEENTPQRDEANSVPTDDSVHPEAELPRVTVPNPVSPNTEDVDRLMDQRER
ncbi:hypothetical protein PHMEG_0004814 [Phytophthora megakarya]|uniref:RNase H type-1 domain-containing protein n=1 Tax=Phytophthora megakarya TaxID=4795 RepID=A0A225WT05_9STRA|nr:hypothetical protein PHMEG_0004814 [Phytophthora megakarya]